MLVGRDVSKAEAVNGGGRVLSVGADAATGLDTSGELFAP
jgi:hypothetical protein